MQYLCENYNLHNIPIGDNNVDTNADHVSSGSSINTFHNIL